MIRVLLALACRIGWHRFEDVVYAAAGTSAAKRPDWRLTIALRTCTRCGRLA